MPPNYYPVVNSWENTSINRKIPILLRMNGKVFAGDKRVTKLNVTGNMNQFWFSLVESGNDVLEGEAFRTPSMMFENVDVSGM
jgi:hypothetical protein